MLTEREQFKVAFLQHCALRGLTLGETHQVVKQAIAHEKQAFGLSDAAGAGQKIVDTLKGLGTTAATGLLLGSAGVGAAGGYLASRGGGIGDEDVEEAKRNELIEAYHAAVDDITRKRKVHAQRQQRRVAPARALV
jgi:hypothetical protein